MSRHFYRGSAIWPARVGMIVLLGSAIFAPHSESWRYVGVALVVVGLLATGALGVHRRSG
jgi:hypothetical protein